MYDVQTDVLQKYFVSLVLVSVTVCVLMGSHVFFFVVDHFPQTSTTPVALTNAAVLFSSARSPCIFSLRALFSGRVSPLRPTCRGQCWSKCSVVTGAVSQEHISDGPIFCVVEEVSMS